MSVNEHETHAAVVAEMRNRTDLDGGDMVDNFSLDASFGEYGGYDPIPLIKAYADRADTAHKREIDALTAELDTAKHCWKVWSDRADELVAKCDKYYAIARKLKDLTKRLCDGLNHIYERECFDYDTGKVYDEARAYLAELDKGGSAIPPPTTGSEVKR